MKQNTRYVILVVLMAAFGLVRLPVEAAFTKQLNREDLLPVKLQVGTGERIGQTFSAVALGGLRTLVATFMNLRAFTKFQEQKWAELGDAYDTIVDLAPRTRYYWDTAAWHQAYNAASYYQYDSTMSPIRRKVEWIQSILRGRDFLERGVKNNPDDGILYERIGSLLIDSNKIAAFGNDATVFKDAYEAYMASTRTGNGREYAKRAAAYALARVPGREAESLALVEKLSAELRSPPPTLRIMNFVLRYHQNPEVQINTLLDEIFNSREDAYYMLGNYWKRTDFLLPKHGIAKALARLELELKVSKEKSLLKLD